MVPLDQKKFHPEDKPQFRKLSLKKLSVLCNAWQSILIVSYFSPTFSLFLFVLTAHFTFIFVTVMGQSNKIFDLHFFSSFEPAWVTDQWVKIFTILVEFLPSYSNFTESPRSIILRGVTFYPGKSTYIS